MAREPSTADKCLVTAPYNWLCNSGHYFDTQFDKKTNLVNIICKSNNGWTNNFNLITSKAVSVSTVSLLATFKSILHFSNGNSKSSFDKCWICFRQHYPKTCKEKHLQQAWNYILTGRISFTEWGYNYNATITRLRSSWVDQPNRGVENNSTNRTKSCTNTIRH